LGDRITFGLFFSTGVDLAYMLFTPGPDEAIDPVMTGLAAAILRGIGQINFAQVQVQVQQGITLFLAVGALARLFAIKKYLYIHQPKNTTSSPVAAFNGKNSPNETSQLLWFCG
jgi:hypothetical protein